jgi:hypothetical protein
MSKIEIENYVIDTDPINSGWVPKKSDHLFTYISSIEDEDCRSDFTIDAWHMLSILIEKGLLTGERWFPPRIESGSKGIVLTLSSRHNKNKHIIIYEDSYEQGKR